MSTRKENILGTTPIEKLLPSMAMPIMFSMLVQALYYIVDGMFVARIGTDAFAAVNLIFPIQNAMVGVAVGTATGMNSLLSRKLGERNYIQAAKVAHNGVFLSIVSWLLFAAVGLFGSEAFMRVNTSNEAIIQQGTIYMTICTVFSTGLFVQIIYERILQVTGKTVFQMIAQVTGAVINIVLDPILIFGYFGLPEMGVAGAALATVIGQWCGMIICIVLNKLYNGEVDIKIKMIKADFATIRNIYKVGIPSIIMQTISSIMVFLINGILISYTSIAVVAFGIFFKLMSFMFMPLFGLVNALVPIVGYNFGAKKRLRIIKAIRLAIIGGLSIMGIGIIIFWAFPAQLLNIFDANEELYSVGIPMLRIISVSFLSASTCIIFSSVFQALGNGMLSLWMSVGRQLVALVPSAYVLSYLFGLSAVWYSFIIAECVSLALAVIFFRHMYKTHIKNLPD